jgi:GNAT superfamily N-acetyltransferase
MPQDMMKRLNDSFIEGMWAFGRIIPGTRLERWPDATVISSDIPVTMCNIVMVMERPADPVGLVRRAHAFFGPRKEWEILSMSDLSDTVGPAAVGSGMVGGHDMPGLLLDPIPARPTSTLSVTTRHVTTPDELHDFHVVGTESFRFPMMWMRVSFPRVPDRDGKGEGVPQLFVCYDNGVPVATSALVVTNGIGGIYFVGTKEKVRKRGYGTMATWAAIEASREQGCDACFLQASELGLPVYERIGFRMVVDYPEWQSRVHGLNRLRSAGALVRLMLRLRFGHKVPQEE